MDTTYATCVHCMCKSLKQTFVINTIEKKSSVISVQISCVKSDVAPSNGEYVRNVGPKKRRSVNSQEHFPFRRFAYSILFEGDFLLS